jgi:hypothetical protein
MKKEGKLHVTLPSIPATSNAFAPLTMQYPSTYYASCLLQFQHHALKIIHHVGCFHTTILWSFVGFMFCNSKLFPIHILFFIILEQRYNIMQVYKASYYKHVIFSFTIDFCLKMKEQHEGYKNFLLIHCNKTFTWKSPLPSPFFPLNLDLI